MTYRIIVEEKIEKDIKYIPKKDLQKIDEIMQKLKNTPRPFGGKINGLQDLRLKDLRLIF